MVLLLIAVYGYLVWRMYNAEATISVNYIDQVTAGVRAIPEEDRGWPLYVEAMLAATKLPEATGDRLPRPGEPGWGDLERCLQQNAATLELLRQAAAKPALGYVPGEAFTPAEQQLWPDRPGEAFDSQRRLLIEIDLPHYGTIHQAAELLAHDARRAASIGEPGVVAANVQAIVRMGRHAKEVPQTVSNLCSLMLWQTANETTMEVLINWPEALSDNDLLTLAKVFAELDDEALAVRLGGDRLVFRDFLQRAYTDDGSGDGFFIVSTDGLAWYEAAWAPATSWIYGSRAHMQHTHDGLLDQIEEWAAQPLWQRGVYPLGPERDRLTESRLSIRRYRVIVAMTSYIVGHFLQSDWVSQQRDVTRTAISLEQYCRRHGAWPDSLEKLVPNWLADVPRDQFDGGPLKYCVIDGQPVLYSIGVDRDDDGGRHPLDWQNDIDPYAAARWTARNWPQHMNDDPADGDWVLYPPYIEPVDDE